MKCGEESNSWKCNRKTKRQKKAEVVFKRERVDANVHGEARTASTQRKWLEVTTLLRAMVQLEVGRENVRKEVHCDKGRRHVTHPY